MSPTQGNASGLMDSSSQDDSSVVQGHAQRVTQIAPTRTHKVHVLTSEISAMAMQHAHWKTEAQIDFQAHQETFEREAWAYEEQAREVMQSELAQAQRSSDA